MTIDGKNKNRGSSLSPHQTVEVCGKSKSFVDKREGASEFDVNTSTLNSDCISRSNEHNLIVEY